MYDLRIGRFFVIDLLVVKYLYNLLYVFLENRVIDGVEFEGLEFYYIVGGVFLGQIGSFSDVRVVIEEYIV